MSAELRDESGRVTPKQYCSFMSSKTLIQQTLYRAQRVAYRQRTLTVVAAKHHRHWSSQLSHFPSANVVVQPNNRGTAAGILLPLLSVLARDPAATVIVMPSDHFIEDEAVVRRGMRHAIRAAQRRPERLVLLGIGADCPDTSYGWIRTGQELADGTSRVECFVEKPTWAEANALWAGGSQWNSFIFACSGQLLLELYAFHAPEVLSPMLEALRRLRLHFDVPHLEATYKKLPERDFSAAILQRSTDRMSALSLPACGWTDLGTPERVRACQEAQSKGRRGRATRPVDPHVIDIARRCRVPHQPTGRWSPAASVGSPPPG